MIPAPANHLYLTSVSWNAFWHFSTCKPRTSVRGWLTITSQYHNKSAAIQSLYYPICQWEEAGLKKQAYVDIHRTYNLPDKQIFKKRPIGRLQPLDVANLFEFIQKNQKK